MPGNGGDWNGASSACSALAWMKRHAVVSGSRLFVCTDGVTEAFDPQGRLWGTRELVSLLESDEPGDPREVVCRILDRLIQFRGDRPREDDETVMMAVFA